MQHVTMFKYDKVNGYISCVIAPKFKSDFEAIGFVDHIGKVKAPSRGRKPKKAES